MQARILVLGLLIVVLLIAAGCMPIPGLSAQYSGESRGVSVPTKTPVSPLATPTQIPSATPPVSPLKQPTPIAGSAAEAAGAPVALPLVTNESVPEGAQGQYTVVKGDTLAKIANRFGVTVEGVMAANPSIKNPNRVYIGQKLIIPGKG